MVDERTSVSPGFVEPTFGQRLLGRFVDAAVLFPVALLIGMVAKGRAGTASSLAVAAAYEIFFVARRGQTVGKIIMGTRVVDRSSGVLPNFAHVVVRWVVLMAGSLVALVLPAFETVEILLTLVVLLPILRPHLHLGVHDIVSGTVVTSLRDAPSEARR